MGDGQTITTGSEELSTTTPQQISDRKVSGFITNSEELDITQPTVIAPKSVNKKPVINLLK